MSKYEKLTNQPLVIALAEFRFSTILTMEKFVSSFQEHLRQDFPLFSDSETQEMVFDSNGINLNTSKGWLFVSSNKKRAFKLDKDRIIFMTSEYDRFPSFWKDCKKAIIFIEKKIKPSLLLRIGLRYSDLINESEIPGEVEKYVDISVCDDGKLSKIGEQLHATKETFLKTPIGYMVSRSLYGYSNLPVWHDLAEPPITIKKSESVSKRVLLDFDHFWVAENETVKFNVDFIEKKIDALHEISREAFWEITTPDGREFWK